MNLLKAYLILGPFIFFAYLNQNKPAIGAAILAAGFICSFLFLMKQMVWGRK